MMLAAYSGSNMQVISTVGCGKHRPARGMVAEASTVAIGALIRIKAVCPRRIIENCAAGFLQWQSKKSRALKALAPKPGRRRAKLSATLRYAGASVSCQTLQEAIMAWQRLPAEQKGTATIKLNVRGGAVYSPAEIERLVVSNRSRIEPRFPPP